MGGRTEGAGRLRVRVASVGKDRSGLFEPAVQEYAQRLAHYVSFGLVEVAASKDRAHARREEAQALEKVASPKDWVVALDERGEALDSVGLSKLVEKAQGSARDLLFVVGGDEGLDEGFRARAWRTVSLSRMTLPHRLARLVLVEQVYRAFTLVRGEPYHK